MLCQKCHKNLATVRYAEVVNGKVTDLHLCPECLSKQQENAGAGFELSAPVAARRVESTRDPKRLRSPRTCKACGYQLVWALESGRVGCSQCYTAFTVDLEPMLSGLHDATEHRGKAPSLDDVRVQLRADLQTKRALLRSAVQTENYEDAAQLRDAIQKCETALNTAESGHN